MTDDTNIFGWPEEGEPCCADKSPGHPVLLCERPVAHEGSHAALIKGEKATTVWPDVHGQQYALTWTEKSASERRLEQRDKAVEQENRSTGAIVTDEQRMETILRIAAQMATPPTILTQDEVDEMTRLVESNPYTITLPRIHGYEDTEKVVAEEPAPFARATFTLTTEHGEIVRLAFEAHPQATDESQWDYVASPVESIIRALRGIGYRG